MISQNGSGKFLTGLFFVIALFLCAFAPPVFAEDMKAESTLGILSVLDISEYLGLPRRLKIEGDYAYILGRSFTPINGKLPKLILIVDISDVTEPKIVSKTYFDNIVFDIAVNGDYLYAVYKDKSPESGMYIFDVSDPVNPTVTDKKSLFPTRCYAIVMDDDEMYTVGNTNSILKESRIFSLSFENPTDPKVISSHFIDSRSKREYRFLPDGARKIILQNDQLTVVGTDNIYIFNSVDEELQLAKTHEIKVDYTDDAAVSSYDDNGDEYCMYVSGRKGYTFAKPVTNEDGKIVNKGGKGVYLAHSNVFDELSIEDRLKTRSKPFATTFMPKIIEVKQNLVCIVGWDGVNTGHVLFADFHDPRDPRLIGSCELYLVNPQAAVMQNDYLYVAAGIGKFYIFEVPEIDYGFIEIK